MKSSKLKYHVIVWAIMSFFCASGWANSEIHYKLNNGLSVTLVEDHRAPAIFCSVWYKVGSADETNGYTGLSHMLEHMLFRGTIKYPDGAFAQAIGSVGGNFNAMTTRDFTMYHEMIPASSLPMVLTLEADRMRNLVINADLLKKEKKVVNEERQMRITDSPVSRLSERLNAAAFVNNPYHHPVIGWPHDVTAYTLSSVKGWYNAWYHPNNAALVLVGDFKSEEVKVLIQQSFGVIPKVALPSRNHRPEVEPLTEKHLLLKYPAAVANLQMAYLVPGEVQAEVRWHAYALEVLANIMAGTEASRFPAQLVRKQRIAASISVSYYPLHRYLSLFQISGVPTQNSPKLEQAIDQLIQDLKTNLVSAAELNRVKAQVIAAHVFQKDSLNAQAQNIGLPLIAGLAWDSDKHWVTNIKSVTPEQVRWVARQYLIKKRLTAGYLQADKSTGVVR